ncbi:transporter substrate-binding domain-containing protein [Fluoribacter dumoffii]|uniref:ABC transporter arginine-binding protein 1 n=1 Tax=Fluoribacter dumoffii TaxID=463 RepID=A0A377GCM2_9GAMM|nr:transporter substrate-binding domain-containing protein [Fluoribacter dumoffii]KTC90993.1 arginine 3rd transport system periplasmic binding protein [Fluoribacter dumoffii NY 23]MCW8419616.1 transporter substrate-binding domain-containing protein [Fluoribacter dumoffii]MCW8455681.1 transporter substrate-binding domain-containing protein [Fluoribacter dumoffii]MCW8460240.1 transporter substrate-binding domain-containing protein [Fluoribacter dumoffii]MCW8483719.1 transporter substrate-binding
MRVLLFLVYSLCSSYLFAQSILIGTTDSGPPFQIPAKDKPHFYGFEIDLMREICQRAQLDCSFKSFNFNDLFDEVRNNHVDLAIGAIMITPDREKEFLFSLPYLIGGGQYATKVSSSIKAISDIKGRSVGIEKGTIFKAWIESQFGNTVQVKEYGTLADVLQALNENKVDAVLLDSGIVQYWTANNSDLLRSVGDPMGSGYGIMANKNNEALIETINKYLLELENDDTYLKLYRRYF